MIVLSIIFLILTVILFVVSKAIKNSKEKSTESEKIATGGHIGAIICAVFTVLFFFFSLPYTVQPGQVGIEILFGKVQSYSPQGLQFKNPFAKVVKLNLRTQKYETKLAGASKDLQEIDIDLAINYRINYEKIAELYNTVGIDYEVKVVEPAVFNLTKSAVSQFPIADVIIKRNELASTVFNLLEERLKKYYVILETVNLNNISFSKAFSAAVEQKQVQEQGVQTAEYERQQAEKGMQTTILNARAKAEEARLTSINNTSVSLKLRWIEAWEKGGSQVPNIIMGKEGSNFLMNLPADVLTKKAE